MSPAYPGATSGNQPKSHTEENLRGVLPLGHYGLVNLLTFIFSLMLFLLALELMKNGAASLTPTIRSLMAPNDPLAGLGFGWLASYVVLSVAKGAERRGLSKGERPSIGMTSDDRVHLRASTGSARGIM